MGNVTFIGLAAAFCTTVSFLPQVVHTLRTRSTKDVSLRMYSLYTAGIFLWLVYGVVLHDIPLMVSNSITLVLSGAILALKLRYG